MTASKKVIPEGHGHQGTRSLHQDQALPEAGSVDKV